jgi:tRNA A-37 threonylcarbamoyl transferase component Bud32
MTDPKPPDDADKLPGRTLDERFRLDELVGEGGMGRVYRGCQLSVDRDVAVKVLHGELTFDEELRERFFREAKVVSNLSHPNIVRLVEFGRDDETGLLYLVMEFIDGVGLDTVAERGRLLPELALRIAHQTCGALVEAHEAGVIHRDLKAENLLLEPIADGTFQTKVVDFGIAYPRDASEKLTMTGRVYGTASYMPPEQARGEEVDERADLFAVGVLLFEMLVGRLPIEGTSSMDVLIRQIRDGPPRLSEIVDEGTFPTGVVALVDRLLSTDPERRPPTAAQVREMIEDIVEREGWRPIRLDTDRAGVEMFEPWLAEAIEVDDETDLAETDERALGETAEANDPAQAARAPNRTSTDQRWGDGDGNDPPPYDPGGDPADPADDSQNHGRLLVVLAVLIGLFVLLAVTVGGFVAYRYLQPETGGLNEVARPAPGGESIETGGASGGDGSPTPDEDSNDEQPDTDPVCGDVDRTPIPADWRGTYRPQGETDGDTRLEVSRHKLNVRWPAGGGTAFLPQTADDDGTYRIPCARYSGSGDGEECEGKLRRRGPVLIVKLEGGEVCGDEMSGAWIEE